MSWGRNYTGLSVRWTLLRFLLQFNYSGPGSFLVHHCLWVPVLAFLSLSLLGNWRASSSSLSSGSYYLERVNTRSRPGERCRGVCNPPRVPCRTNSINTNFPLRCDRPMGNTLFKKQSIFRLYCFSWLCLDEKLTSGHYLKWNDWKIWKSNVATTKGHHMLLSVASAVWPMDTRGIFFKIQGNRVSFLMKC